MRAWGEHGKILIKRLTILPKHLTYPWCCWRRLCSISEATREKFACCRHHLSSEKSNANRFLTWRLFAIRILQASSSCKQNYVLQWRARTSSTFVVSEIRDKGHCLMTTMQNLFMKTVLALREGIFFCLHVLMWLRSRQQVERENERKIAKGKVHSRGQTKTLCT